MTDRYHDKDIIAKWIDVYVIPLYHRTLGYRLEVRGPSSTAQINTPSRLLQKLFRIFIASNLALLYRTRKSSVKVLPSELLGYSTIPTQQSGQSLTPLAGSLLLSCLPYRFSLSTTSDHRLSDSVLSSFPPFCFQWC
jgi:hypothetical protein